VSVFVAFPRSGLVLIFPIAGARKLRNLASLRQAFATLGVPRHARKPTPLGVPLTEITVAALLPWQVTAVSDAILATVPALLSVSAVFWMASFSTRRAQLGKGGLAWLAL
jgi:hypothetical protein